MRETPLGLYKGLGAVISGIVPKMAIRFASFESEPLTQPSLMDSVQGLAQEDRWIHRSERDLPG